MDCACNPLKAALPATGLPHFACLKVEGSDQLRELRSRSKTHPLIRNTVERRGVRTSCLSDLAISDTQPREAIRGGQTDTHLSFNTRTNANATHTRHRPNVTSNSTDRTTDRYRHMHLHYKILGRGANRLFTRHIRSHVFPVRMSPVLAVELLFFAIFGQTTHEQFKVETMQPEWTRVLFKLTFGIYMLVSVVVLINLLIAMMSDTYQRIQAQSDIEWKYGLSKLVRNMHRTSTAPSPLNLFTTWMTYLYKLCKKRAAKKQRPSLVRLMGGLQRADALSPRSRMGAKWLSKVKKTQVAHKDSVALSVVHLSPLGSQLSFSNAVRIDNVVDWEAVRRKYRDLYGDTLEKHAEESKDSAEHEAITATLENSLVVVPAGNQAPPTTVP